MVRGRQSRPAPHAKQRRAARIAATLALTHRAQDAIDRGTVPDRAEVARRFGMTLTQGRTAPYLAMLAPGIQERCLSQSPSMVSSR